MADERKIGTVEIDRLYDFLDGLQASGYTIDPRQYLALSDLLITLIARGDLLEKLPLKTLIAPLICSTPAEQQDFYQRFDRWYHTLLPVKQASLSGKGTVLPPTPKRRWSLPTINRTVVIWVTVIVAVIALTLWLTSNSTVTETPVLNNIASFYGAIFAVFGFIVWLGRRVLILYQENQYITRELANQEPIYTKVPVNAYIQDVMPIMQFKPIVSALRKRTQVPSSEVDVDRTIANALNRNNWLEIVYRQQQVVPEYVVLIDRKSRLDQQACFVQEVLAKLEAAGVWLHQYEFSGDPRICFPLNRKDTPLRLKELQSRHPDSRLLIFSDTNELINPLTGLLQDWLESLSYWQERAILTPDKLQKVLFEELEAQNFAILPMTFDGLASLVRTFETDNAPLLTNTVGMPAQLVERPMRWIGRDTPLEAEVKALVNGVENYLGENGFYWLCATAVYPELRWELTLHLGSELKDDFGKSLLNSDLLIRIARLPWFRFGYMPDWVRIVLVERFNFEQEAQVRKVLDNLLSSAYNGQGFDLQFARNAKAPMSNRIRQFINAVIRNSSPESELRDHIFVKFIAKKNFRKLSVRLPSFSKRKKSTNVRKMPTISSILNLPTITSILAAISLLVDIVALAQLSYNLIVKGDTSNIALPLVAIALVFALGCGLGILGLRGFRRAFVERVLQVYVWGYLLLACAFYLGVVIILRSPYTINTYISSITIILLLLIAFMTLRSTAQVRPIVAHALSLMTVSVLHALIFLYNILFISIPEINNLIGELAMWLGWTLYVALMIRSAFSPSKQVTTTRNLFSYFGKQPSSDIIKIGIFGPSGSGKSTYIAMLQYADCGGWTIKPRGHETQQLFIEYSAMLRDKLSFIPPTLPNQVSYLSFDVEGPGGFFGKSQFRLVIPEASGEYYEKPGDFPEILNELSRYHAIIWLIDPVRLDNPSLYERSYKRMIHEWLYKLYEIQGGGTLRQYMAFCLTKMDLPAYSKYIDNPKDYCLNILGGDVEKLLNNYCNPNKVQFFATSSIGFTHEGKSVIQPNDSSKLFQASDPLNLFDPFIWIFDSL